MAFTKGKALTPHQIALLAASTIDVNPSFPNGPLTRIDAADTREREKRIAKSTKESRRIRSGPRLDLKSYDHLVEQRHREKEAIATIRRVDSEFQGLAPRSSATSKKSNEPKKTRARAKSRRK